MSIFNLKIFVLAIFFLITAPLGFRYYYQKTHPQKIVITPREEVTVTIIPGWNLRQVADYLVKQNLASSTEDVYKIIGQPAFYYTKGNAPTISVEGQALEMKSNKVSLEGYLAPETYRVYRDATLIDVIEKLVLQREKQITSMMYADALKTGRSFHEIMTMASILEEEAKSDEDRARVADILWRRADQGWPLQVDSSVHYAVDKSGDLFTTAEERKSDSFWNTYKYPDLPPGPISNPSLQSIQAAIYPIKNNYWYFLSGKDGKIYYGKTLEEHNRNKKYL